MNRQDLPMSLILLRNSKFLNYHLKSDDNGNMKTLNGIIFVTFFTLLTTGCMPESLTKFKKDTVKNSDNGSTTFVDEDGNVIDSTTLEGPTSFNYPDNYIIFDRDGESFVILTDTSTSMARSIPLLPTGDLGDILSSLGQLNMKPTFTISPSLPTGLALNSETGTIDKSDNETGTISLSPSALHTVTLTYTDPDTLRTSSLVTSANVAVMEPIDESFRVKIGDDAPVEKMFLVVSGDVTNFTAGGSISASRNSTDTPAQGTIQLVNTDTNTIVVNITSGEFKVGDSIDNAAIYSGEEGTVDSFGFYFETTTSTTDNVHLVPVSSTTSNISSTNNGVSFTISPDLPTGLSFDTSTGEITGKTAQALAANTYTVKATNLADTSGKSFSFDLAIVDAPQVVAYNTSVVMKVASTTGMSIGDNIATNFSPPLTSGAEGIIEFISGDYIVAKVTTGTFEDGQSIDINRTYVDEETTIVDTPQYVNAAIDISSSAGFTDYTTSVNTAVICTSTARGTITKIDSANNILFVSQTVGDGFTGNFVDDGATTISNTSSCGSVASGSTSGVSINSVWSSTVKLNVASAANFIVGQDVYDSTSNQAAATISSVSGNQIVASMVTEDQFNNGNNLTNNAIGAGPYTTSITSVETNNKFEIRRGEGTYIKPFLALGSENFFSISPNLPDGLVLNSTTGSVSGTPTEATNSESFTVTVTNSIGSFSTSFDLEVVDYFEVLDNLNGPSYVMHKEGRLNKTTACRIDKKAIENFYSDSSDSQKYNVVDIDCFLEAGESDLFNLGLDLQVDSGPDVCEFVQYYPYSYWQFKPQISQSPASTNLGYITSDTCINDGSDKTGMAVSTINDAIAIGETDDVAAGVVDGWTTFDFDNDLLCGGSHYNTYGTAGVKNCDYGQETHFEISLTDGTSSGCKVTITEKTSNCGGTRSECIAGAITQNFNTISLDNGFTRLTSSADNGLVQNYEYEAPISNGYNSNISLANYAASNSCESSTYEYSSHGWSNRNSSVSTNDILDPYMGAQPFYTFACTDSAGELKARIRVMVRDWDYTFTKSSVIDEISPTNMDRTGSDIFGNTYNERYDFDNLLSSTSSSYSGCAGEDSGTAVAPSPTTIAITDVNIDTIIGSNVIFLNGGSSETFNSFTSTSGDTYLQEGVGVVFGSNTYIVKDVISSSVVLLSSPSKTNETNGALSLSGAYRFPASRYK